MFTNGKNNPNLNIKLVSILISILNFCILFDSSLAHKFTYSFKRNENFEILFFLEDTKEMNINTALDYKDSIKIFFDINYKFKNEKMHVYTYKKENFICFALFDNFLSPNSSENAFKTGIIECNFELSYFLRICNDIIEIPSKWTNYDFKSFLQILTSFKAIENKRLLEYLQVIIFNNLMQRKNSVSNNRDFELKEVFGSCFFSKIDISIKKLFIIAYLNVLMIESAIKDGNLILMNSVNDYVDSYLFNEHIPYGNILVNDFKIFCALETVLENAYMCDIFHVLLSQINIKSLIFDAYQGFEITDIKFKFNIVSSTVFKSIIISNFKNISLEFLNQLCMYIEEQIEFFTIKESTISQYTLDLFCKKKKLLGLKLNNVTSIENTYLIDEHIHLSSTLKYIDFNSIDISPTWWMNCFQKAKFCKIILTFCTVIAQKNFLDKLYRYKLYQSVLHFEIMFFKYEISSNFCNSLTYFLNLKTLKLRGYQTVYSTEIFLFKAIEGLKGLEFLDVQKFNFYLGSYNFLLRNHEIKVLRLTKNLLYSENRIVCSFNGLESLTELHLVKMNVSRSNLIEIFRIKNLEKLCIKSCTFETNTNENLLDFVSNNIKLLDFDGSRLENIKDINFLSKIKFIEYLNLPGHMLPPGYLSELSFHCNSSLKTLHYEFGTLNSKDLSRIEKLEMLEELNISESKFCESNFYRIGNDCKFFNSLKVLNLWFVEMHIEDLKYLKNFRRLIKLSLSMSGLDLIALQSSLNCISFRDFSTSTSTLAHNPEKIVNFLKEKAINLQVSNF
ncbi:hypothetical protein CWI38_0133p0030 [Hamiltosporidium tvaerminnensis]|uniref:Leucine-rich repeat-containing protein n=1 Tax=Hamiltosporidium tvaerminnensis TaxID=1176355 RepID=A0A4Q9M283_9MICR|nr:hypothetical protein CWI38_0133p0030 [Hamiltosporidium tvaerminnensis]